MPSSSPCLLFDQTLVSSLHGLHGYGLRASGGLMGPWGRVGLPAAGSVLCQFAVLVSGSARLWTNEKCGQRSRRHVSVFV